MNKTGHAYTSLNQFKNVIAMSFMCLCNYDDEADL